MHSIQFAQSGRTVVLSDLHLNALWGAFERVQEQRVCTVLELEKPQTVVLNGDTLDLFFGRLDGSQFPDAEAILRTNSTIVHALQEIPNLYVLIGAHDQALRWDAGLRATVQSWFPNCRAIDDCLVDDGAKIAILPGVQWYYDNAVCVGGEQWMSLTKDLTGAFEEFVLSGRLDAAALRSAYVQGKLGFWYRTGSHYEFLQGMERTFDCRADEYFERIAKICLSEEFSAWARSQFYDLFRSAAEAAPMWAKDGGPAMRELAVPYWKILGRAVRARLDHYLATGYLDYPPHANIPFRMAIVGHTHLSRRHSANNREILFTGSTKPQTRMNGALGIAQNELGGGYVVIENGQARLEKFEPEILRTDLQQLSELAHATSQPSAAADSAL